MKTLSLIMLMLIQTSISQTCSKPAYCDALQDQLSQSQLIYDIMTMSTDASGVPAGKTARYQRERKRSQTTDGHKAIHNVLNPLVIEKNADEGRNYPNVLSFFESLAVQPQCQETLPKELDRSIKLGPVELQGETLACSGFALSDAMEHKTNPKTAISKRYMYGLFRRSEYPQADEIPDVGVNLSLLQQLSILQKHAIPTEADCPWSVQDVRKPPEECRSTSSRAPTYYKVGRFSYLSVREPQSFKLTENLLELCNQRGIERLIYKNYLPIAVMDTDVFFTGRDSSIPGRTQEKQDAILGNSFFSHELLIVGYDAASVYVRNSLAKEQKIQRIPWLNFLSHLTDLAVISVVAPYATLD